MGTCISLLHLIYLDYRRYVTEINNVPYLINRSETNIINLIENIFIVHSYNEHLYFTIGTVGTVKGVVKSGLRLYIET